MIGSNLVIDLVELYHFALPRVNPRTEKAQHDSFGGGRMLLLAEPRRIRRIRSLGHSLHRLTATMPFRHLTLKRPFYNGFVGPVPTGSCFLPFRLKP